MLNKLFLFLSLITIISCSNDTSLNIEQFGAKGDGITLNTKSIQSAIDKASEKGGGVVLIPNGTFITGTLYLKDNVELHLNRGAKILGSSDTANYPLNDIICSRTKYYSKRALIFADGVTNIAITGFGTIDGNSDSKEFSELLKKKLSSKPLGIQIQNSDNITIRDINLRQAGLWMQHYLNCENLTIDNIKVFNHNHHTNDGLDIDGCRTVRVNNCYIDSHDDAIAIKSTGFNPCEDITISNCIVKSHCHGIKMGTESTGGFKRININNCCVSYSKVKHPNIDIDSIPVITAIALEVTDGGTMEQINVNNITVTGVFAPIFIKLGNRARKPCNESDTEPKPGIIRDVNISNLIARNAGPFSSSITGFEGNYVQNVNLSNITVYTVGGITKDMIMDTVPENETHYPEIKMFGNKWSGGPNLPSYGLFVRHVDGLSLKNVKFITSNDARKEIYFEDVKNVLK